jgi:cyclic pyranopterin phosphate synthase
MEQVKAKRYNSIMKPEKFTHIDAEGNARMVNVSEKPSTLRIAEAAGEVILRRDVVELIQSGSLKKGDLLTTAQIAGIQGAKKTSELIPLCHPLNLTHIQVDLKTDLELPGVLIRAKTQTTSQTGVEMEALCAVSIAALTVYDMIKAVQKDARIENIRLLRKTGGTSGDIVNE